MKPNEVVLGIWDFNRDGGRRIDGFEGVHGGCGIGKRNVKRRRVLEFCDEKGFVMKKSKYEGQSISNETFSITQVCNDW